MGGQVTVRLNLNSSGYSAEMTKAQKAMQSFSAATSAMGHGTVSQMQAASAAIRVLEGGMTGNIRAAERFISTLPGVGKALQAAFPLVGGIALAGVFVKIADEAAKAIQKVNQAEQQISNSFRTLNLSGQTANDMLAIANDRLENEISKLQGKPQNNLAIAIDEARLAADKMAESLDRDNAKIKELLSQNAVPWWAGFLGKAGTSAVSDTLNAQNQHLADLANQANVLQHQGDQSGADRARAEIEATRQQYLQANARDIAARQANQNLPGGLNQGANISALYGQQGSLYNQVDQQTELKRNVADQAIKQQLDNQKAQQEAAKRAAEAVKQAQELIVQQWRRNLDEQRTTFDNVLVQEGQFWVRRMEESKKGSLSYIAALDEANKAIARMRTENMRGQGEFDKTSAGIYLPGGEGNADLSKGDTGAMKEQGRDTADWLKTLNQGIELHHANADAIAQASIQMELMTGRIGKLDAAQMTATLHEQEYRRAVDAVNQALANAQNLPDGADKRQTIAGLNNQMGQIQTTHVIQSAQDQQSAASQQIIPAMQDAVRVMTQEWTNMAQQIVQIMGRTADSLNDDIAKAVTGQGKKGDFGRTFMQAGQGLVKTGLQSAEGNILKMLHIGGGKAGKPDGSKDNPYHVVPAGSDDANGSAAGGSAAPALGGIMSKLGPFIQPFIPHFASGGDVLANRPSLVGENGPELFMPSSAGRIVPNNKLGGGGDTHVYHIDARGSNDPAAVHAAVARALPHAVSGSVQAVHQSNMRSPGGRR